MKFAGQRVYTWHLPVREQPQSHGAKVAGAPPKRFVTRPNIVPCPQCHAGVDVAQQGAKLLPRSHRFWRLDTRRVTIQCAQCKNCFRVFAYPLFNWVPPYRIITGLALLNALVVLLVLVCAW